MPVASLGIFVTAIHIGHVIAQQRLARPRVVLAGVIIPLGVLTLTLQPIGPLVRRRLRETCYSRSVEPHTSYDPFEPEKVSSKRSASAGLLS
jgi:hypothetical protein